MGARGAVGARGAMMARGTSWVGHLSRRAWVVGGHRMARSGGPRVI